jgi:hypothetical protein
MDPTTTEDITDEKRDADHDEHGRDKPRRKMGKVIL